DQYALALLARLLLTGYEPPATNEQTSLLYTQPTNLNPLRLSEPEIDNVLFKALAPHPADRFPNVMEFAQALQNAILKQIRQNPYTALPEPSQTPAVGTWADPSQAPSVGAWVAPSQAPSIGTGAAPAQAPSVGAWAAPRPGSPLMPPSKGGDLPSHTDS